MTGITRTEYTAKLRQLADLLDEHPAIPAPEHPGSILVPLGCDDEARVDELAAYLTAHGIAYTNNTGRTRGVTILDGMYDVYSTSSEAMAWHDAWSSYSHSVQPDDNQSPAARVNQNTQPPRVAGRTLVAGATASPEGGQ